MRHGTATFLAALKVATGEVLGRCLAGHRSQESRMFLDLIDRSVPAPLEVYLVLDNYATHKTDLIKGWLAKRARFPLHFTPTHASWLNQIEQWFALLTARKIKRGSHSSVRQLIAAIEEFISTSNRQPKPFNWYKSSEEIIAAIPRFAPGTLQAHAS